MFVCISQSAHFHQLTPTVNRGLALRWDGFVLMFNILCHTNNLQVKKKTEEEDDEGREGGWREPVADLSE